MNKETRIQELEAKIISNYISDWEEAASISLTEEEYKEYAQLMDWETDEEE